MQIVIDIPKEIYCRIMARKDSAYDVLRTIKAVKRGKVLPKGHGRLVDGDVLKNQNCCSESYVKLFTIVEADKEVEYADSD